MRYLLIILILVSCTPEQRFQRFLEKNPEFIKVDTVYKTIKTPEIKDSSEVKTETDSLKAKEAIKEINKTDCPEKDKIIIRDIIYRYTKKPIDTTIITAGGAFIFKDGKVFYYKPADSLNVPVSSTTIQKQNPEEIEPTWGQTIKSNVNFLGAILIGFIVLCIIAFIKK